MATQTLPPHEWGPYFDRFAREKSRTGRVDYAEVRVFTYGTGSRTLARWLPLVALTYDPNGDLLEVTVDHLDHFIYHPERIYVDESDGHLDRIEAVRLDGTRDVIEIR